MVSPWTFLNLKCLLSLLNVLRPDSDSPLVLQQVDALASPLLSPWMPHVWAQLQNAWAEVQAELQSAWAEVVAELIQELVGSKIHFHSIHPIHSTHSNHLNCSMMKRGTVAPPKPNTMALLLSLRKMPSLSFSSQLQLELETETNHAMSIRLPDALNTPCLPSHSKKQFQKTHFLQVESSRCFFRCSDSCFCCHLHFANSLYTKVNMFVDYSPTFSHIDVSVA